MTDTKANPQSAPAAQTEGIELAMDLLGIKDPEVRSSTRNAFQTAVKAYLGDKSVEGYWGNPKEQRAALRQLQFALERASEAMQLVAPEFAVAVDGLAERFPDDAAPQPLFLHTKQSIDRLRDAIGRFDANYQPKQGRPNDFPLEEVVRNLIEVMMPLTEQFPRAQMNKHNGARPKLKSAEARAIGLLLQDADPALDETKIVNMIEKVRTQPLMSDHHLDALIRSNPNAEMDASLLAGRNGH